MNPGTPSGGADVVDDSPIRPAVVGPSAFDSRRRTALLAGGLVIAMTAAAYAAVPLYDLFCRRTGFGGTTRVAAAAPGIASLSDRIVTVRFDASTDRRLPWAFRAPSEAVRLRPGESGEAVYTAHNMSNDVITGVATYNVSPPEAGFYFSKIDCFCFTQQTLQPGETVDMPVTFFVDRAVDEDPDAPPVKTITLSYTFFPANPAASTGIVATRHDTTGGGRT